ncbi:MAG: hypothetical protein KKC85_20495, partial [Gammaproteobacteria bacterium]|nr:hypothetical protein [Gammaproteobacteria bacterium]
MSIRTRLFLLVFAVWLPAVVGFGLLAASTYSREADADRDRIARLADTLNIVVERELNDRAVVAQTLAASSAVRNGDLRKFYEEASSAWRGANEGVVLVDRAMQLVNTQLPVDSIKPTPRPPGAIFQTDGPGVYFIPKGQMPDAPALRVLVPEAKVTPPRYNVGVTLPPSEIQSLVDAQVMPQGAVATVIDSGLRVIARSRDAARWFGAAASGNLKQRADAGVSGFASSVTLDGIPSLTYLSRVNRYGWRAVIALPTTELEKSARRVTFQVAAASGLLLLGGLALALFAARGISAPMMALRKAAGQLGRDHVPPLLATGVTEADEVARALHEAGLQRKDATHVLEQRVDEAVREADETHVKLLEARKHEAIGRLTGGLAHDFNNLLQTISMGHQILARGVTDSQQRVLQSAMHATGKAADLVRQMLTFGRAQTLKPQPVQLNDLVLRSQELTSKAAGERVGLSASIAPGLPPLFVDPIQLELALLNLVFNARDAMSDGGQVTITGRGARRDESSMLQPGFYVCLQVADNGPGMSPETMSKAFDPYFTTKPVGAGSGLGLAQVLAFARQSGGDVRLESRVGEGTSVTLILPTCTDAPVQNAAPVKAVQPGRRLDVLMVEDDLLVKSVVVPSLEGAGHRVTHRVSADAAVELLSRGADFDVLFTDVVMPGSMSGLDLVVWCQA